MEAIVGKACLCLTTCSHWSVVKGTSQCEPQEVWSVGSGHVALHLLSSGYLWNLEMPSQTRTDFLSGQGRPPCQFEINAAI